MNSERPSDSQTPPQRRLYGRGAGRSLSARQAGLVDTLLPRVGVPQHPFDPRELFPAEQTVRLEIGFGAGDHLVAQAQRNPGVGFIGVEHFLEGVGKALARLDDAGLTNVRIHAGDGRDVLERLAPASIEVVYVLFPDPWPKTRHRKRRLIQPDTVTEFARVLAPGGVLRVATDVRGYTDWTLQHVRKHPSFEWAARCADDWRNPPGDHETTRYETKNLGDCAPTFLNFVKL